MGSPLGVGKRRATPEQPGRPVRKGEVGERDEERNQPVAEDDNSQQDNNQQQAHNGGHSTRFHGAVLDRVLEAMEEGVMLCDFQGIIKDMNTSLCAMFGWSREELTGAHINMLMPDDLAAAHDGYMAAFAENVLSGRVPLEATQVGKLRLMEAKRKSGELFPIQLTVIPVQGTLGDDSLRLVAYIRDITHKVEAEESLAEAMREQNAREMAQYLLGYVNHELRNPLQGIQGLAGLLLEQLDDLASSRKRQACQVEAIMDDLDALDKLVQMLERVVDDLQELRQVEENDLLITPVPTTANTPVSAAAQLFARSCSAKQDRVAFECSMLPLDPPVWLDPNRIVQVLGNFLSNAIKYTDAGQVTVGVGLVRDKDKGPMVRYYVRDTGRGIPPHKLEDVFQPYEQMLASDARLYGGTGLGLHLCKRIADKVGGTVGVTSEVGKGSEFFMCVPFVAPKPEPEVEAAPCSSRVGTDWEWISNAPSSASLPARRGKAKKSPLAKATWADSSIVLKKPLNPPPPKLQGVRWLAHGLSPKVFGVSWLKLGRPPRPAGPAFLPPRTRFLVVDNRVLNRAILVRMLRGFGAAEVLEASDGAQALDMVARCCAKDPRRIAVVFVDLVMDGMSGVETARGLRQRGFAMPVVGVSSDVSAALKQEAREAGVSRVLTKPCRLDTFRQCLGELQIAG